MKELKCQFCEATVKKIWKAVKGVPFKVYEINCDSCGLRHLPTDQEKKIDKYVKRGK